MEKIIRFPKPDRLARGRNNYFETSGVSVVDGSGVVELYAWTGKGDPSQAARIVVPYSHLREFRDAINDMLTHVMAIEGERIAAATGAAPAAEEKFEHDPSRCPSDHWNRGDDICEDCGTFLGA